MKNYPACRVKILFGLRLYLPVNSYGHVKMVSSPNHTFSWANLTKLRAHFFACNWQQPFVNQRKEKNDSGNNFTINLPESMESGRHQNRDPCISSWTRVHYRTWPKKNQIRHEIMWSIWLQLQMKCQAFNYWCHIISFHLLQLWLLLWRFISMGVLIHLLTVWQDLGPSSLQRSSADYKSSLALKELTHLLFVFVQQWSVCPAIGLPGASCNLILMIRKVNNVLVHQDIKWSRPCVLSIIGGLSLCNFCCSLCWIFVTLTMLYCMICWKMQDF